jgi:hypothetical protein
MTRHFVAEIERASAPVDAQIDRRRDVGDAMHERIVRRLRGAQRFDVGAQILDVRPPFGAQLPLESPAAERQEARPRVAGLRRIEPVLQIALEYVGP